MSDAFISARLKLDRAKKHLADFKRKNTAFLKNNKCVPFTEAHPDRAQHVICKVRLTKNRVPKGFSETIGDAVDNLRSALDCAVYGVAIAAGHPEAKEAYFPFSGSAADFERNLKGRCRDVPKEIYPLLRSFEPYKGGSNALFALNVVCVSNKHKLVIPCASATLAAGVSSRAVGFMEMPYPRPAWDSEKNEMVLFTANTHTQQFHAEFDFAVYVAFG